MDVRQKRGILTVLAILLAIESLCAAFFGLGVAYRVYLPVGLAGDQFKNITAHGNLLEGASISYSNLFSRGNVLTLGVRPAKATSGPSKLSLSVCGGAPVELTVEAAGSQAISFRGECEPRTVSVQVLNPAAPGNGAAAAGARIVSAEVGSRFGIPIVAAGKILKCAGAIFLLALLMLALVWGTAVNAALIIPTLIPICAFYIIRGDTGIELRTETPLWIFLVALCAGALCALFASDKRKVIHRSIAFAPPPLIESLAILAIVTFAAGIRFYGLSFGLPANFHPDEVRKVEVFMQMIAAHDLNPHYFRHPTLLLYLSYFTGLVAHRFWPSGEMTTDLFLAGRTVSAVAGSLTVYLLYRIGRRLYSPAVGLGAAALLAALPLHITCSRYLKEDALLTFFVTATALAIVKAAQEDKKFFLFAGGALAGCAASTKYPGVLAVAIVCTAPWLRTKRFIPDRRYIAWTAAALVCVPIFFLLCSPYILITPQKFLADFASEQHHMQQGHSENISAWSQLWMYHFARSFIPGMTSITAVFAVAALGFLLWRRKIDDLFVVSLVLLYYLPAEWVKAKPAPQPERYVLPCLPFLALALSEMARSLARTRARSVVVALFTLCLVSPAVRSVELASEIMHDTRNTLGQWMSANLPHGSPVCIDWPAYEPPLPESDFKILYLPRTSIFEYLRPDVLREQKCDYFMFSSLFYDRYFSQPETVTAFRALLRDLYEHVPIVKEVLPRYGTYGFHNPRLTLFSLKQEDFAHLAQQIELKRAGKIDHTANDEFAQFRPSAR